ncbi:MAG: plasmid replication, integration and excision activator [Candidatus Limnocylindrales bacterium]
MALSRHIPISMDQVFPSGAYALGAVEQVVDFDASTPEQRVQAHDRESGLPLWAISVFDPDPEARTKVVRVKIASRTPPVLPQAPAGSPFPAVSFDGLTATGYVDTSGSRPRLAWSFRATAVRGASPKAQVPQGLHRSESGG